MTKDSKTIYRSKHRRNYTVLSNDIPLNPTISWKAKGLLWYLLSKPEDWQTRVGDLVKHGPEQKAAVMAGLKELKLAGYLKKVRVTCPTTGRVLHWETHVFDEPQPESQNPIIEDLDKAEAGEPDSGKSDTTKYRDLESNELNNRSHLITTTKDDQSSSSREREDASLLEGGALDKEMKLAKWLLTSVPALEQQYAIDLSTRLVKACVGRCENDLLAAFLAMLQCEDSGKLRDPQRYLENAIAGEWLPSKYWLENGESASMWTIPQALIEHIESKRPVEELVEVSA